MHGASLSVGAQDPSSDYEALNFAGAFVDFGDAGVAGASGRKQKSRQTGRLPNSIGGFIH
jgi:hypothetical protein